ncbi:MAG: hypothetical protein ACW98X_26330 [Promethearchaeota archaeon]|jgi:hypothetical protein
MKKIEDLTQEQKEERELLLIAMCTTMYDRAIQDFRDYTDRNGFVELYLLMQQICDRLLLSENSEFFKSYSHQAGDGSYYQDKHNTCWDWYWMDRAEKEIAKSLEGHESDYTCKYTQARLLEEISTRLVKLGTDEGTMRNVLDASLILEKKAAIKKLEAEIKEIEDKQPNKN